MEDGGFDSTEATLHEVQELECSLLTAEVRGSAEALGRLLHPAFVELASTGEVIERHAVVRTVSDGEGQGQTWRASEMEARWVEGGCVLVTFLAEKTLASGAIRLSRRASIWRRDREGAWRMLFHAGVPLGSV